MAKSLEGTKFSYKGIEYTWSKVGWHDNNHIKPPKIISEILNKKLNKVIEESIHQIGDPVRLARMAIEARDSSNNNLAIKLAKKSLSLSKMNNSTAMGVLCSTLRKLRKSNEAVQFFRSYKGNFSPPLLTTLAAALCDIGKYREALNNLNTAYSKAGGGHYGDFEIHLVYRRIEKEAPEIYKEHLENKEDRKLSKTIKQHFIKDGKSIRPSDTKQKKIVNQITNLIKHNKYNKLPNISMFSCGYCPSTLGGPGAFCTLLKFNENVKHITRGFRKTILCRMGILSAIEGLSSLKFKCNVTMYCNIPDVVKAINNDYISNWHRNNWINQNGSRVEHADLWINLFALLDTHDVKIMLSKYSTDYLSKKEIYRRAQEEAESHATHIDQYFENKLE